MQLTSWIMETKFLFYKFFSIFVKWGLVGLYSVSKAGLKTSLINLLKTQHSSFDKHIHGINSFCSETS